jgi:mannose-6-phosphate isomerase-like protein (cupin superfamily)
MESAIVRNAQSGEFLTPERCSIFELLNLQKDASASLARARVVPGVTTQLHRLNGVDERYVIVGGVGYIEIDGSRPERVEDGDVVLIPNGASQRITNPANVDLVFLCLCTPRFEPRYYEALE